MLELGSENRRPLAPAIRTTVPKLAARPMQYVRAPISTVCIGRAASFGTVVLMAGAKGRRFSLPSSNIHMHQPLIGGRGLQGQASDLDIHAREIIRIRGVLNELIAKHTGQPLER